jgi:hypothetical protein
MTTTLRARFGGKVLIPEGPVNLPTDRVLEIHVADDSRASTDGATRPMGLAELVESLPPLQGPKTDRAAQHDHYLYGHPKRP